MPSEILAEVRRLPCGMLERIVEYRAIALAVQTYERDPTARGGIIDDVIAVEFELARQEIAQRSAPG